MRACHDRQEGSTPAIGQDEILASIEFLGRKVLPAVRQRIAAAGP
jgi:hypothetical protein